MINLSLTTLSDINLIPGKLKKIKMKYRFGRFNIF